MTPTAEGVGQAIAKHLERRAIVRDVYGPFRVPSGAIRYRVKLNNGASFEVFVREDANDL